MMRIDNFFASLLRPVLKVLCGLTRWSNFRWARITFVLAAAISIKTVPDTFVPTLVFACCLLFLYHGIERELQADWDLLSTGIMAFVWVIRSWRLMYIGFIPVIYAYVHSKGWHIILCLWLYSMSMYFATDFHPRRPSWFRRAVGKMVNAAKNIKLRLPSPLPHPA